GRRRHLHQDCNCRRSPHHRDHGEPCRLLRELPLHPPRRRSDPRPAHEGVTDDSPTAAEGRPYESGGVLRFHGGHAAGWQWHGACVLCDPRPSEGGACQMLWTIVLILLVLWLLGGFVLNLG